MQSNAFGRSVKRALNLLVLFADSFKFFKMTKNDADYFILNENHIE